MVCFAGRRHHVVMKSHDLSHQSSPKLKLHNVQSAHATDHAHGAMSMEVQWHPQALFFNGGVMIDLGFWSSFSNRNNENFT